MNSLQDALYNWLTIKVVADVRKDDLAAQETAAFFYELLTVDHELKDIVVEKDEEMYRVLYTIGAERKTTKFPTELIDVMLDQMVAEPEKFINYPK
ncbi:hypothetical protein JOC85_000281 [Bacillus mesophilus]|uniref:Uncharacterized protein n=1 Tax=Bacillus mesophilus TaxID=1808955 RepID=A0A6M0Q283_9BACI|nr:hypothetical protein [Bacillus mesophilus]MBM7659514.1 hypothetical protein [Bacillus mesophilus]NEY70387.1 hypothetical protein [Bacillus mesophilus]